jgi:hypothetical protein
MGKGKSADRFHAGWMHAIQSDAASATGGAHLAFLRVAVSLFVTRSPPPRRTPSPFCASSTAKSIQRRLVDACHSSLLIIPTSCWCMAFIVSARRTPVVNLAGAALASAAHHCRRAPRRYELQPLVPAPMTSHLSQRTES